MADTSFYSASVQLLLSLAIAIIAQSVSSAPVSLLSTGEEMGNKDFSYASSLAKIIAEEAGELYNELCTTPNLCSNSMEGDVKLDLKLPEITESCLSKKFNKEQCLHQIHGDLPKFEIYITFLNKSFKKEIVDSIQYKTKNLAEAVKKLENNPREEEENTVTAISMGDLNSKDSWKKKLTTYLILQSFKDYMIKTSRAIRHSSN